MNRSNFGAVRLPLLAAAVLASFAVSLSAQVVERGRTYADLVLSHPCNSGSSGRLARVTDAQSSSSIGGGGGSTQVWAVCDGVDTWTLTNIGGSGGLPGANEVTESMLKAVNAATDEYVLTYESTVGDFEWQANVPTATALAANGANCSAGSFPLGVDASGTAESCTVAGTIGGTLGATDKVVPRSSGTGAATLQASSLSISDNGAMSNAGSVFSESPFTITAVDGGYSVAFNSAGAPIFTGRNGATMGLKTSNFTALQAGQFRWGDTNINANPTTGLDTGLGRLAAGVVKGTDASTGIRWLQGGGAAVASATAMPVPTGRVFHVTGTTTITSITSTNFQAGVCITLIFDDALTFTDGSNLKLNGDFVTTADDTWHGCYDGTNWYEEGRSVN